MAYSQRQKKKSSQLKKRHYDQHKRTSHLGHKTADKGEEKQQVNEYIDHKASVVQATKDQEDPKPSSKHLRDTTMTYNDDTIQIDDATFSLEGPGEEDTLIEERLSQLLSVRPSLVTNITSQQDNDETQEEFNTPLIDLNDLARTLISLPLHQKLLIDKELVELCEKGHTSVIDKNDQLSFIKEDTQSSVNTAHFNIDSLQKQFVSSSTMVDSKTYNREEREEEKRERIREEREDLRDYDLDQQLTELLEQNINVTNLHSKETVIKLEGNRTNIPRDPLPIKEEEQSTDNTELSPTITSSSLQLDSALDELLDM